MNIEIVRELLEDQYSNMTDCRCITCRSLHWDDNPVPYDPTPSTVSCRSCCIAADEIIIGHQGADIELFHSITD